ncbi:MAG: hypothetical protein RLY61_32 [Candidatus Parcubacteria bacterium]|jgi:hypothetical protein
MTQHLLQIVVKNRKKTFVNGDAYALTSYNEKGLFDILPYHENFISLISKMLAIKTLTKDITMQFESAVLLVQNDFVHVFISDLEPYYEDKPSTNKS